MTLIDAADLARTLDDVAVLDVRWSLGGPPGRDAYLAGHVPGARFVDLETELADPPGHGGRHPLPDPGRFVAAMRSHGVSNDRPVVIYDARDGTAAARGWWLLRHYGHHDVRLLDGGFAAWVAAELPVVQSEDNSRAGDFDGGPGGMPTVAAGDLLAYDGVLLDARTGERYRGEVEPVDPVAGHIPGAASAPTTANVGEDGRWCSPEWLRERFAALGVGPGTTAAAYCGSGVTAAHEVFALERAGLEAALYPGSWSEWITDLDRPIGVG